MPKIIRLLFVLLIFALGATVTAGGGGDDGGDGGSGGGGGGGSGGRNDAYIDDLRSGSRADAYYQVWRCSNPVPGTFTKAFAEASTDTWPSKSRYLSHNATLYVNEVLRERTPDIVGKVASPSESNYLTSIPVARAAYEISCPQAIVATFRARTWHKGISIYGARDSFYKNDTYN